MPTKNKTTEPKAPKTIKVSSVITAVVVLLALLASFIGGAYYANNYNSTVEAKAVELSSKMNDRK